MSPPITEDQRSAAVRRISRDLADRMPRLTPNAATGLTHIANELRRLFGTREPDRDDDERDGKTRR